MKNFISRVLVKPSCLAAFLMASGCAGAVTANLAAIASTCATDHLRACEVVASAVINMDFAPPVSVQIQSGYTEEDGIRAGLVIYEQKNNSWQILMEDYQGVRYGMPQISEGEVLSLLHISGQRLGTGIGNADLLFTSASDEAPWQSVDIETWKETIGELLPQELAIWHGVDYDFGDWAWTGLLSAHRTLAR